jgi:hypothetical protein
MENGISLPPSYGPVTRLSVEPDQSTPNSIPCLEVFVLKLHFYTHNTSQLIYRPPSVLLQEFIPSTFSVFIE